MERGGEKLDGHRLEGFLEAFAGLRVLVVGDVVLDEYVWGSVDRVSPEAPVPVVCVERESVVLGGAGNVVRNVRALGARCAVCTVVGDDADGRQVMDLFDDLGVDPAGVVVADDRPTTRKTRVVARGQQVVRFDRESVRPLEDGAARQVGEAVEKALGGTDVAILQDYGKGLLAPELARRLMDVLSRAEIPVAVDPKRAVAPFRGASLLKPNLREAEVLSGQRVRAPGDLDRVGECLLRAGAGADVVLSRGRRGLSLFQLGHDRRDVPTVPRDVFDVQGAGDTSIAILALARRVGANLLEAAVLANAGAGVVVGKVGTATAGVAEIRQRLPLAIAAAEGSL